MELDEEVVDEELGEELGGPPGAVVVDDFEPGLVVVDEGTVVVVVVVVVPSPSGYSTVPAAGGVNVIPTRPFPRPKRPAHWGSVVRAETMKSCHSSAGMVPPWTLLKPR